MVAAYADPPYLGCGKSHYGDLHPDAADWDDPERHRVLIAQLEADFDCWAMSLSVPSLPVILPMCPPSVRVCAWVKPFASFKPNVTRAYTWEPVIFKFSRAIPRTEPTWRDHISAPITLKRGLCGAKPEAFCFWLFEGLALRGDDELVDLFPGSGAVWEAWLKFSGRSRGQADQIEIPLYPVERG